MNRFWKKSLSGILSASVMLGMLGSLSTPTFASDSTQEQEKCDCGCFIVEGITYKPLSNGKNEVEVVNGEEHPPKKGSESTYSGDIKIPETVTHEGTTYMVTKIGKGAFGGSDVQPCPVKSVELPNTITEIGDSAFSHAKSLSSLNIPESVTTIGVRAFAKCYKLKSLEIPAGVTTGVKEALGFGRNDGDVSRYPHLDKLSFSDGSPYEIYDGMLYKGSLLECVLTNTDKEVKLKEGTTEIGYNAFMNSDITSIDLTGITKIGEAAFQESKQLKTVTWPTGLESLDAYAFRDCTALKDVNIQGPIKTISEYAFNGCLSLETIKLPETLEEIGEWAFALIDGQAENNDPKLESINIPPNVKSVGAVFLAGVKPDSGTALIFEGENPPEFAEYALSGITGEDFFKPAVYYPAGAEEKYAAEGSDLVTGGLVSKPSEGGTTDNQIALEIPASASVKVGNSVKLNVESTLPTGTSLVWSSSDTSVATVSNGTITGVKAGNVVITASIEKNGVILISKTCNVTVSEKSSGGGGGGGSSTTGTQEVKNAVYRAYNPNSGEHFYTPHYDEFKFITKLGWDDEGIACMTEMQNAGHTLYRLYNPNSGLHHYTLDENEKNVLVSLGWDDEGVAWYTSKNTNDPAVYRLYNQNDGQHHYTMDVQERDALVKLGWNDEGIGYRSTPIKK